MSRIVGNTAQKVMRILKNTHQSAVWAIRVWPLTQVLVLEIKQKKLMMKSRQFESTAYPVLQRTGAKYGYVSLQDLTPKLNSRTDQGGEGWRDWVFAAGGVAAGSGR